MSNAHWLQIDLLRDGVRTAAFRKVPETEYQVYLSRAGRPRSGYVWPIQLNQPLPVISIPLRGQDQDLPLNLQSILSTAIDHGSYDLDTDYNREPTPPLSAESTQWARDLITRW